MNEIKFEGVWGELEEFETTSSFHVKWRITGNF